MHQDQDLESVKQRLQHYEEREAYYKELELRYESATHDLEVFQKLGLGVGDRCLASLRLVGPFASRKFLELDLRIAETEECVDFKKFDDGKRHVFHFWVSGTKNNSSSNGEMSGN